MARPTKLTDEIRAAFLAAAKVGATDEIAAEHAGIHPATYYRWMELGRAGRAPYREFCEEVTRARATCSVYDLNAMSEARTGKVTVLDEVRVLRPARRITHPDGRVEEIAAYEEVIPRRVEHEPGDWRAGAHRLAVRHPENYARQRIELRHTGPGGGPVQTEGRVRLDVSKLPLDQVLALAGASSAAELGEVDPEDAEDAGSDP